MSHLPVLHRCPTCSRCFKRPEHLQRHSISHSGDRPFRCNICIRTFQRADVLTRHLRTCNGNIEGLTAKTTKRRACDQCVRSKRACSFGQPCSTCESKNVPCSYSNVSSTPKTTDYQMPDPAHATSALIVADTDMTAPFLDTTLPMDDELGQDFGGFSAWSNGGFGDSGLFDLSGTSWQDFLRLASGRPTANNASASMKDGLLSLYFLENFTSRTGLVGSFECGTLDQRKQVASNFSASGEAIHPIAQTATTSSSTPFSSNESATYQDLSLDLFSAQFGALDRPSWFSDPLALETQKIITRIREVVVVKPRNSSVTLTWSSLLEEMCLQFFSPVNIRKFLGLYWAVWHPNVNFVHRPTFDVLSSTSTLVASMAIIGACVSPEQSDNENARTWFNCVEEMVFSDDDFCNDFPYPFGSSTFDPTFVRRRIQALQAAYIVCLYQSWEGTDASKRRVRRYRYSTVVAVVRDIGIANARHLKHKRQARFDFQWHDFVVREEMIRSFLWVFLLDTAFVIFNNLPPRMVIKEMKMHMASDEACFQAATADECYEQLQRRSFGNAPTSDYSFCSTLETICKENPTEDLHRQLAELGVLNLFAITSALHSLIFHYHNSIGCEGQIVPLRNALANLKIIWHLYCDEFAFEPQHDTLGSDDVTPENMWKRVGFMRHAPEYWLLASLRLDHISPAGRKVQQPHGDGNISTGGSRDVDDTPVEPIVNEYDQTSMRQVNQLIAEFQTMQIL